MTVYLCLAGRSDRRALRLDDATYDPATLTYTGGVRSGKRVSIPWADITCAHDESFLIRRKFRDCRAGRPLPRNWQPPVDRR